MSVSAKFQLGYHKTTTLLFAELLTIPGYSALLHRLSIATMEVRVMWKAGDDDPTDAEAAGTPLVNPKQPLLSQVHVLSGHGGAGGGHKRAASAVPPGGHNYVHIRGTHPLPASVSGT
ncbi:MAG: hypothetical protein EOO65_05650 [Methanosarcinales archaeon]|nr:MAG: hypothetical protein EOO65_05650 [Methanosarcinales archaeon]